MLDVVVDLIVALLLIIGCPLALTAAVGLHRFPDVLCRMHAATKPATLGLVCVTLATGFALSVPGANIKLLLVIVLQFLTAPVAAHMVGRAAYRSGIDMSERTMLNELGGPDRRQRYGTTS